MKYDETLMSVPLSLRLCCIAAMAPALTETNGQTRIQLPGSPPPIVSDNTIKSGNRLASSTKISKTVTSSVSNCFNSTVSNCDSFKRSLERLGLSESAYLKLLVRPGYQSEQVLKKMNQPSVENGPNGTGCKFIKQRLSVEEAFNGHVTEETALNLSKHVKSGTETNHKTVHSTNGPVLIFNKSSDMCKTQENGIGKEKPTAAEGSGKKSPIQTDKLNSIIVTKLVQNAQCQGVNKTVDSETCGPKPIDLEKDASRKQQKLERRSQFLLRRIRRLQGRQVESHVKSQLKSFVEFQHQNLQIVASRAIRPFNEIPNTFFNSTDIKNLSTSNLVALVRKLQSSQPKQDGSKSHKGVLNMEKSVSSETERKAGHLRTNVRHWNTAVDDEATESSSGGESCEEWEDCPMMSDKKAPTPL